MKAARVWVTALALLCVVLGYAVGRSTADEAPPRAPTYLEQLDAALGLRPEQMAALDRLLGEQDRDLEILVEEHREEMREVVAARLQRTEDEMLREVLDEAQRHRYQSLQETAGNR